ncbi:hypothetical protein [Streptomyces acidiscabies]|uniref:hypothetical protein n=1 Tax=Streptomyces acidiscabies TaxID=42234 RepID=UPI0038F6E0B7
MAMAVESVEYEVVDSGLRPSATRVVTVLRPAPVQKAAVEPLDKAPEFFTGTPATSGISSVRRVVLRC